LGRNGVEQNIKKALELASVCEHPSAVWLTKLFGGRDVDSPEKAREVLLGCENDSRALCFAGWLGWDEDEIRRAADLGDAFAQAWMAWQTDGEVGFRWAEQSAAQGERDGFFWFGHCYRDGTGCEKDEKRAKENFLLSLEMSTL
jgi:TPR repeat protein